MTTSLERQRRADQQRRLGFIQKLALRCVGVNTLPKYNSSYRRQDHCKARRRILYNGEGKRTAIPHEEGHSPFP